MAKIILDKGNKKTFKNKTFRTLKTTSFAQIRRQQFFFLDNKNKVIKHS
jgi:hypothetical protein